MPVYVPREDERPEGAAFEALKPGSYRFQVEGAAEGYAQRDGAEYVKWSFAVVDLAGHEGQTLIFNSSLNEKAASYPGTGLWAIMSMFGIIDQFEGEDLEFPEFVQRLDELTVGETFYATVARRMYQGKPQNDFTAFEADQPEAATAPAPKAPESEAEQQQDSPPAQTETRGPTQRRAPTPTTSPSNRTGRTGSSATPRTAQRRSGPPY